MAAAITITWTASNAAGLRRAASRSRDMAAARRMLALALVLEGRLRTEAVRAAGVNRHTLRNWVHGYNEAGLAGLSNRTAEGKRPYQVFAIQTPAGVSASPHANSVPPRPFHAAISHSISVGSALSAQMA